ncbi:MAG: trypsin-like peptidase domain-containing protein [Thaumarchaeota archaeon]|nr:trypsin-like peptidase domain-containing protein [Nitrososphaerota archaeon]
MTRRRGSALGLSLATIAVLVIIIGAVLVYYDSAGAQVNSSNSRISTLQSEVRTQQSIISSLENQQTQPGSGQGNTSVTGIDPVSIYEAANRSVVTIQGSVITNVSSLFGSQSAVETVLGSGIVTSYLNSVYIITNYHVVNGVSNITVTFGDGDAYPAKVVGTDPYSDIAVVTTNAPSSEFIPLEIVSSSGIEVGQPVVAIGNPYGLSGSMTFGIISQLGRTIQEAASGQFSISGIIQFSAPINPGNSGGPLLNANGMVIGITTATVNGSQGLGFAIPSSTILKELPSLISTGQYDTHSYLGISAVDMNYQLAQASGTNVTYGVLVENIVSGGPADKAGLKVGTKTVTIAGAQYLIGGDIITSLNGTKIVNQDALATYLEENTVSGQTVQLGIIRAGAPLTVTITLGQRPPPPTG